VSPNGQAEFVNGGAGRAVPISFDCDYSAGTETRGRISVRYRDPRNLYGQISADIETVCVPLSPEEIEQQNARDQEAEQERARARTVAAEEQARRDETERKQIEDAALQARQREQQHAQRVEEERHKELAFSAEQQRTKPSCMDVSVTGLIASSVMDVEALHAPHLTPSELEDVLARHPYSCQINTFGVAYGCRGGAHVRDRRATVKNWTATHYIIEIPLEFQMGRRDAPAWVRRSEARCRR
jgi:hypothetical protein